MLASREAREFIDSAQFVWHQRFHLSADVATPGSNDIEWLLQHIGFPTSLEGLTVLDIGTSNGGAAFIAGAMGPRRIVAVDICDPDHFGFAQLNAAVGGSQAQFVQASVYELPGILEEKFDVVLFLGVLYHLRHPLLAIDSLRRITKGSLYLETAVSGEVDDPPNAVFFPSAQLGADASNWFAPNINCLKEWLTTSGFVVDRLEYWPSPTPDRAFVLAHPAPDSPEFEHARHETRLDVKAQSALSFR